MMPKGWKETAIGNIAELVNGRGFKPHEWKKSGLPIIRIQNLNGGGEYNYYDGNYDPKIEVHTDDLLYAWSGSRGTSFGPHIWTGPKGLLNYHTWKVRPNEQMVNKHFLLHLLKHVTTKIENNAHGASALVHMQKWAMEEYKVQIPANLSEQEKIAKILSTWDEAIEKLAKKVGSLELEFEWFLSDSMSSSKTKNMERTWKTYKLSELANFINGRGFKQSEWTGTGLPIIRIQNMNGNSEYNYYDGNYDKRHFIKTGDLLFAWSGNRGTSFGPNIWSGRPGLLNQHIFKVENTDLISKEFLYLVLKYATKIIERKAHGGSGLVHVTKTELAKFEVELPGDKSKFLAMSDLLLSKESELKLLTRKLELFRFQKRGLMQQLLNGKKRVEV